MKLSNEKGLLIFPILKDLNSADGILLKNEGIKAGFSNNGVHVSVLDFNTRGIFNGNEQIFRFSDKRLVRIYQYNFSIWKKIEKFIHREQFDFVWFRIPLINNALGSFVKSIKINNPSCKIIIEYGAYPYIDELSGFRKVFYTLNKHNEKKAHSYMDYIITYCGQLNVDGVQNIPIDNGIDTSRIAVSQNLPDISDGVNFISVSSLKKWHACERFILGLPEYVGRANLPPVHFNIVGNGPEYNKLKMLTSKLRLDNYVTFHGFKTGQELDLIYNQNHVAVGTLGFHRIGINNSSSLKNREYLARGLPAVLSTPDKDIPSSLPYVKYVEPGEGPLDISSLITFALEAYKLPNLNQNVRKYAEDNLSWTSKIRQVLSYLYRAKSSDRALTTI